MGFTVGFGGYFIVDLIDAKSGRIKEHYEFPNLITDLGLDQVAQTTQTQALFNYIGVGTDATAPTVSDTALGAEVDRTNSNGGFGSLETDGGPITGSAGPLDAPFWFQRLARLFLEGEANGNLVELGWFQDAAAGTMIVRSLFKDSGGTPIVITKTSADQLRIIYEYRIYPPVGENPPLGNPSSSINSGEVIIGPTTHSWTGSAINIDVGRNMWAEGAGALGSTLASVGASASPSGSALVNPTGSSDEYFPTFNATTNELETYVIGSFERDILSTWESAQGNVGGVGINMLLLSISPVFQDGRDHHLVMTISPSIPKTSAERLRVRFRVTIDRAVVT